MYDDYRTVRCGQCTLLQRIPRLGEFGGRKRRIEVAKKTLKTKSASELAADHLESNAESFVATWIDWLQERADSSDIWGLPERAVRNHVPPVLLSLADYIRDPAGVAREELIGHLKLHGTIRRDQGYSLKEVLAEFDGLAEIVTRALNARVLEAGSAVAVEDVLEMASRLAEGLRSVSFVAMGTYDESDEDLERTMSAGLEEFARAVIHDLRNPLHALSMGLELIEQISQDDEVCKQTKAMKATVRRAAHLLETIHVLAVAEKARATSLMIALKDAVMRVVEEVEESAALAGVRIDVSDDLPLMEVEAIVIYLALINLVANSIRYSDFDKDEKWIRIDAAHIEEESNSGFCEVRVSDNGIGIPEELLPRVTKKGFRAHPEHGYGTGMGLYMVSQSLTERGGCLMIESKVGEGTTVTIRMRGRCTSGEPRRADLLSIESLVGEPWLSKLTLPRSGKSKES
jgi:signal transduction histidine kinase